MVDPIITESATELRRLWFRYLDTVAPHRPRLHAYCLKLTGSIFDAEDLLQETLLKGFGTIGRGEFSSEAVPDVRAYLCRIATNAWIDEQRKLARATRYGSRTPTEQSFHQSTPITPAAGSALYSQTSPQERAAIVLKDVFDFSLEEIAALLSTTVGAVKAALHRGREKLSEKREHAPARLQAASPELIDKFIAAFQSRDIDAITGLLLETVSYEVQGVGCERGRKGIWLTINIRNQDIEGVRSERRELDGELVLVGVYASKGKEYLASLVRLEESDGKVARVINYYFCPDTLAHAAAALGYLPPKRDYHQDAETLARMIADASLPWEQSRLRI